MFFIWQTSSYGTGRLIPEQPAEIYRSRAIPCTPAGDLVGTFKTATEAQEMLPKLSGMSADEASAFIASQRGDFSI